MPNLPVIIKLFTLMKELIRKRRTRRQGSGVEKDPKKELLVKSLSTLIERAGVQVRREELKRGHGWKATSGFCHHNTNPVLFLDRLLPQDEQISFLLDQIEELKIQTDLNETSEFPEVVQRRLAEVGA